MRIKSLFDRPRAEQDLAEELEHHLERQSERNLARGLPRETVQRIALREAISLERVKDECRDARGTAWVENALRDIRYASRTLRKSPSFTVGAVFTLALGIGANTALFNVMNTVLLRPLPYPDPNALVYVEQSHRKNGLWTFSYPAYLDLAQQNTCFESVGAWRARGANLTSPGEPEFLPIRPVAASFLKTLGVSPILGRDFSADDDRRGAAPVAIIDHALWLERFGGRRDAVGSLLVLNGKGYSVIGILPASFRIFDRRPILIPIGQLDDPMMQRRDAHPGIQAIARLRPGVDLARANAELKLLGDRLASAYPGSDADFTFRSVPLKQQILGDIGNTLVLMSFAVAMVLLIACANVANLFLARSVTREREFTIRTALGAGRARLLSQLFAESMLVTFAGGALGFVFAAFATNSAVRFLARWIPRTNEISVDYRVLLFCLGVSILSGCIFGVIPGLKRRLGLETALRQGARSSSGGVRRWQSSFVVMELALAIVLLTGAGLMLRTVNQLLSQSPGFNTHALLTMTVALPPDSLVDGRRIREGWRQTLERVRNAAGVHAAALDSIVPLNGDSQVVEYWTSSEAEPPKGSPSAFLFSPTPDYLRTMGLPLLSGRFFTEQDRIGSPPVIVVDEAFARKVFPGQSAIGRQISVHFVGRAQIIGVVANTKHRALDERASAAPEPAVYAPLFQFSDAFMQVTTTGMSLLVRTSADPKATLEAVKRSIVGPARGAPIRNVATMDQVIGESISLRRGITLLLTIFAALALALAVVGIYSVIAYATAQRVQEIGIRVALGAPPRRVLWLVVAQGMRTTAAGVAVGLMASYYLNRLLVKFLYHVAPADPLTFGTVTLVLFLVSLLATYLPALRASRIDPVTALRYE